MRTTCRKPEPSTQFDLFGKAPDAVDARQVRSAVESGRRFVDGNRNALFVYTVHFEQCLLALKEHTALKVSRLLDEQNWRMFESRYATRCRAPYAQRALMGLILYGVMQGVHSLHVLERLARLDFGLHVGHRRGHAGPREHRPFHCDVRRAAEAEFFESLTRMMLRACGSDSARAASDGTVVEKVQSSL